MSPIDPELAVRSMLPPDHPDYLPEPVRSTPAPEFVQLASRDELHELAHAVDSMIEQLEHYDRRLVELEARALDVAVLELKPGSVIVVDIGEMLPPGPDDDEGMPPGDVVAATEAIEAALERAGLDPKQVGILVVSNGVELTVLDPGDDDA